MIKKPINTFNENLEDVKVLLAIHEITTGEKPGKRYSEFSVLNKSAIVLLVACWEFFIENLAEHAFSSLLKNSKDPSYFPKNVKKNIVQELKKDLNELKILDLAGNGWKNIFKKFENNMLEKSIGKFNTPSSENIDSLFTDTIGLKKLSKCWSWHIITPSKARLKLSELIRLRGDIAHKIKSRKTVHKGSVEKYVEFIKKLAEHSNDCVNDYLKKMRVSSV